MELTLTDLLDQGYLLSLTELQILIDLGARISTGKLSNFDLEYETLSAVITIRKQILPDPKLNH